jgi:GT2 family glycosyltransferase
MREGARQLHELYRVPFRVVFLTRNLGFAGANNAAVPLTSGRLLLLLNSDVMPSRPGWLARMRAFYDATPGIGSLGVKLLYEDDTLQHAGLYFRREPNTTVWENEHYFKGLEQTFAPANVTRKVPGVTGACLMISRALYLEQGGLRGMYLQGDYEDSDLCLRLLTAGYDNWYLADVALYHLEGQSYGWTGRTRASRYNAWTHTHLWDDVIRTTMAKFSA